MKTMKPVSDASGDDRLNTIWAIIEARQKFPSIILVAGATDADNTSSIACGLAEVSQRSGQGTGYVRLPEKPRTSAAFAPPYTEIVITPRSSPREAFDFAAQSWRAVYDVVFVDIARFSSQALAAHIARLADGVVVAVCEGRRVTPADRELTGTLQQLGATVIGVVKTKETGPQVDGAVSRRTSLRTWLFPARQQ